MRWGIESESTDNHSEVATCLNEIKLCQKYSVATNFVVRYDCLYIASFVSHPFYCVFAHVHRFY